MSSIYAHKLLQDAIDIRVLSLYPADSLSDALRGELKVVNLDSSADFEALSYTWGPPFKDQLLEDDKIEISGQMLSITGNLGHALRRLRLTTDSTVLWVDSICIDQADPLERGHQVGFMADIFGSAIRVLAWLGEDSEYRDGQWFLEYRCDTEAFFRDLNIDKAELLKHWDSGWNDDQPSDSRALAGVFQARRYFTRRWVLQEQIVARDIVFICGESRLVYEDFVQVISSSDQWPGLRITYEFGVDAARRSSTIEIVSMLAYWESAVCSDERDIVLALVSLWRDIDLRVDYSMPTEAVYVAFAEAIVHSISISKAKSTKSKDPETELRRLLSRAAFQDSLRSDESSLPSWVPDWRLQYAFPARVAEGSVKLNAKVTNGKKLQLTVVYYGEIYSEETDTKAPKRRYYLVPRTERTKTIPLGTNDSFDQRWLKRNTPVDGAMICSVLNGITSSEIRHLLILQPTNQQEQEYKIICDLEQYQALPAAAAAHCQERRITIV